MKWKCQNLSKCSDVSGLCPSWQSRNDFGTFISFITFIYCSNKCHAAYEAFLAHYISNKDLYLYNTAWGAIIIPDPRLTVIHCPFHPLLVLPYVGFIDTCKVFKPIWSEITYRFCPFWYQFCILFLKWVCFLLEEPKIISKSPLQSF